MTSSFREARRQITGDSWLDDLARASLSAAEAKFETPPTCPPSAVHDMITTWTDSTGTLLVFPGDLVLIGTTLETVEAIAYEPPDDECVRVDLEGWAVTHCASPGHLVAVRRYDTGEG